MSELGLRNKRVLIHISLVYNIGPVAIFKILRHLYNQMFPSQMLVTWFDLYQQQEVLDLPMLYEYTQTDFEQRVGLTSRQAMMIMEGLADSTSLQQELARASDYGIRIVTLFDECYPELLRQIHMPPIVLYVQGLVFQNNQKCIGIVGSRKATAYAQHAIDNFIPTLVTQGWHIVSGGAEGADTMAHVKTLEVGGYTTAVLGSGLLVPYPSSNKMLFKRMSQTTGSVVSPFPLLTQPDRVNFPARNRIIAGLSLGCIVVQAAQKSGALITAHCSLEEGRQVFAVPGAINDELSAGCHSLIKQGAKLVASANDILEEFSEACVVQTTQPTTHTLPCEASVNQEIVASAHHEHDPVLNVLTNPATLDEIIETTKIDVMTLQDRLFTLQLEGRIRQTFAGMWERA